MSEEPANLLSPKERLGIGWLLGQTFARLARDFLGLWALVFLPTLADVALWFAYLEIAEAASPSPDVISLFAVSVVSAALYGLGAGALATRLGARTEDRPLLWAALRRSFAAFRAHTAYALLSAVFFIPPLVVMVGSFGPTPTAVLFLVAGGIYLGLLSTIALVPAIAAGETSARAALRRSLELSKGHRLGLAVALTLILFADLICLLAGVFLVGITAEALPISWLFETPIAIFLAAVALAFGHALGGTLLALIHRRLVELKDGYQPEEVAAHFD
ncbi:MAG: hypothetical protein AAF871_16755 [Pseudomonadota bacterium]